MNGNWVEQVLHSFNGPDGATPTAPVVTVMTDASGDVYGTTAFGGAQDGGTVFEITH
jgi:uncharacterized repeat protein (TIGR03803 family)